MDIYNTNWFNIYEMMHFDNVCDKYHLQNIASKLLYLFSLCAHTTHPHMRACTCFFVLVAEH